MQKVTGSFVMSVRLSAWNNSALTGRTVPKFYVWVFFRKSLNYDKNNVEKDGKARQATYSNIIRRKRSACWMTQAADKHSECVILTAFPWLQWFCERSSVLCYTYMVCLVSSELLQLNNWKQEYLLSSALLPHKGKAIPLQAWTGREGSRRLRLPDFKTIGTWRW